jgi:hypothetical protein
MTKTPYELRFDLLAMAQSILSEQNMNERARLENDWNMECEQLRINAARANSGVMFSKFPKVPQYDVDQVIAMAEKLNEFVSRSS